MRTKIFLIALSSSLTLAAPALLAQNNGATNLATGFAPKVASLTVTNSQPRLAPGAGAGKQLAPPSNLKVQLNAAARPTVKPVAEGSAKTRWEFEANDAARIEAARAAHRQAQAATDEDRIQAARTKINLVWDGLESNRGRPQTAETWAEASGNPSPVGPLGETPPARSVGQSSK